jgi:glycogen(starch) synthase
LSKKLETLLMNRADQIVTLSEPMRAEIITRGIDRSKVHMVPNAVDANQFMPRKPKEVLMRKYNLNNCKVIGFIGSFFHYEGVDLLIKAFKSISKNSKKVKLLLIGDGEERDDLEKMALNFDLGDTIIFTGEIEYEKTPDYYALLDIAVFPRIKMRLTELVCPIKLIEAMATSTPVIGSDVAGTREYISDGITGLLFKPDDDDDLAQKIETLLADSSLYDKLCEEGRNAVLRRWNWPTVVSKYQEIYNMCLDNRYSEIRAKY